MKIKEFKEIFLKEIENAFSLIETLPVPVIVFSDGEGELEDDKEIKEFIERFVETVIKEKMEVRNIVKSKSFLALDRDHIEERIEDYDDDDIDVKEEFKSIVELPCVAFLDFEDNY
jgi:hypothetical protein